MHWLWAFVWLGACLLLGGCLPDDKTAPAALPVSPIKLPAQQYAALAQSAKGIAVGPAESAYTVYVVFDPQCLHCARLWAESKALQETVKFIWVPVAFFDARGGAQSAALLASSNPREDLDQHELAILARAAGIATPATVAPYLDAMVQSNTALVSRFHVMTIPYIVTRNQTTSAYVAHEGVMSKEVLRKFLGLGSR